MRAARGRYGKSIESKRARGRLGSARTRSVVDGETAVPALSLGANRHPTYPLAREAASSLLAASARLSSDVRHPPLLTVQSAPATATQARYANPNPMRSSPPSMNAVRYQLPNGLTVVLQENHARQGGGVPGLGRRRLRRRAAGARRHRPRLRAHAVQGHRAPRRRADRAGGRGARAARSTPGPRSIRPSITWCSPAASSTPGSTSWPTRCRTPRSIQASSSAS